VSHPLPDCPARQPEAGPPASGVRAAHRCQQRRYAPATAEFQFAKLTYRHATRLPKRRADPELTHSARVKLDDRVPLPRASEILSSPPPAQKTRPGGDHRAARFRNCRRRGRFRRSRADLAGAHPLAGVPRDEGSSHHPARRPAPQCARLDLGVVLRRRSSA
jgi:hypothetical protein